MCRKKTISGNALKSVEDPDKIIFYGLDAFLIMVDKIIKGGLNFGI
jgi:hypothetical protein